MLSAVAVSAFATDLPKPIEARYKSLVQVLNKLDAKSFKGYFTDDFVNIDPKGKKDKLPEFLKQIGDLFATGKSATTAEKTLGVKMEGETVAVKCDIVMHMVTKDGGTLLIHEVCTDYWKKVKGNWLIYKTVETTFDVKPGESTGGKPIAKKKA